MKISKLLSAMFAATAICILCGINTAAEDIKSTEPFLTEVNYEPELTTTVSIDEVIQTTSTEEESVNGWADENGKRYYIKNGEKAVGFCEINGSEYYFAANGAVKSGWYTIDGVRMYFSPDTYERKLGWLEYNGSMFYLDENGKAMGRCIIDEKYYIFDEYGICQLDWFEYEGSKYYSDLEHGLYTNECKIDDQKYYFSSTGRFKSGWVTSDGKRIFYDYDSAKPLYGFISYNGNNYYSDEENGKLTGINVIDGIKYKFDNDGCQQLGIQEFSDGTRYYDENGKAISGFVSVSGNIYYFNENYLMQTGLQTISGKKYYFNKAGVMQTGFQTINNKKYYFDKDGIMQTGWQNLNNKKYYFNKDGVMQTGFQTINDKKYYFNNDGVMQTGWQTIKGKKYYFNKDGIIQTDWQKIKGKYYFLGKDGALQPGVPKVFVGVGHGGYDSGAVGYIVEKEYTFKTAQIVAEYLKAVGIEFMLSRYDDIDTTMESKLKLCNDYDPDLIIDIHFNAVGGNGFEVYHSQYGGMSLTLAQNINKEVSKIMKSNGCKIMLYPNGTDRFTIIRETHAPAVLLEGGYVDNYYDAEFIKANYKRLAKAYAEGVLKTLELIMKTKT